MSHLDNINSKIVHFSDLASLNGKLYSAKNKKVVFTNGCFDLVHKGHIHYLSEAADLGDYFIVGLNADTSVSRLKGPNRPIKDEETRAMVMAAFEFVDLVVIFDTDTPLQLIEYVKPDVLVKGGDYDPNMTDSNHPKFIVGSEQVRSNGGRVDVLKFIEGESSSRLIEKSKS